MHFNSQPIIKDNQASITFDSLTLSAYKDFIKVRQLAKYEIRDNTAYFPASYIDDFWQDNKELPLPLTKGLFDYQKVMVLVGFAKQRYAFFADAGLGKTLVFGELIRQLHAFVEGRIVVCVPLNILSQFEEMCQEFFDDFPAFDHLHNSKMSLQEWCYYGDNRVAFVNHEMFIRHDKPLKNVDAFLLDESSILKGGRDGNGKIAKNIIDVTQGIKFKYAASATPSPNDRVEYAMHALYLEDVKSEKEFTSLFFVNKDGQYVLRKHAHEAFYKRLALWSIFIRNPANYGFDDNLAGLKSWKEIHKRVEITPEQDTLIRQYASKGKQQILPGMAIKPTSMRQRGKFSQISKGFAYDDKGIKYAKSNKPEIITQIVKDHYPEQVIIWTVFDTEGDIIEQHLKDNSYIKVAHITGKTSIDDRVELIEQFRNGELGVVISKPKILGFGLNFQHCHIAICSGLQDSYEQYYQSVKRIHRYGQTKQVLIYHVYTEYEQAILSNVLKKKEIVDRDFAYQEKMYIDSLADELKEFLTMEDHKPLVKERIMFEPIKTNYYTMYHTDSLKMMLEIAGGSKVYEGLYKNSVDFSIFSPPFMADLFTYSDDPADMGNTRGLGAEGGLDEFILQFRFFLKGMMHVTKPGRFMAMHLENVPLRKNLDGYIGVYPFVNKAIDIAIDENWIMFGDPITILKNQQMQAITKKVSSLTMTSMETDRSRICPAMNGYLVLFKKPGENQRRIADLARCKNCGWEGYLDQLTGFDEKSLRGYKSGDIFLFEFSCPECNNSEYESYSDMAGNSENGSWTNGDKWIMLAEGAWPEHEMFQDDYSKMAKMSQEQRWQDLLWTSLGIWPDINESDVLYRGNKQQEDTDKHLCPLPRSIIKRALELYSLPGETIYIPFSGSGTGLDQAIRLNRKVIAGELKPEYFTLSVKNAELAITESQQLTLWDLPALEGV
jgi:superfamily II DNA or RNA helicase